VHSKMSNSILEFYALDDKYTPPTLLQVEIITNISRPCQMFPGRQNHLQPRIMGLQDSLPLRNLKCSEGNGHILAIRAKMCEGL
jgi:hypothetical protein